MPSNIILKKSSVAARIPVTGDLEYGELALNYTDGALYYKRSDNTIQNLISSGGGSVTLNGTETLTNKTIVARSVNASATSGTLTPDSSTTDLYVAERLTGAITIAQPSGTPTNGQKLIIRLKDNGTSRGITWTTSAGAFRAISVDLPVSTTADKLTYVGCIYNTTDSFWDVVASVTQA